MAARIPQAHLDAWRGVLNAHAAVVERAERELAEAGLPPLAWYDVLWAVRRAPGRRARMAELAEGLTVSRGGLTKLATVAGRLSSYDARAARRGALAATARGGAALRTLAGARGAVRASDLEQDHGVGVIAIVGARALDEAVVEVVEDRR